MQEVHARSACKKCLQEVPARSACKKCKYLQNSPAAKISPTCSGAAWQYRGASLLEELTATCSLAALPPLQHVTWTFNNTGESVRISQDLISVEGSNSTVRYTPLTELDYGSLLCWGTNAVGKQRVPCGIQVFPAGRPDPPDECEQLNFSVSAVTVSCKAGFDGGLRQNFTLELYEEHGTDMITNVTNEVIIPSLLIKFLI
ncbi:Immunoglobulin-like domain [Trinorchestia longiramus]|nr:Immunoglobulin-like domain [Trinorchestia longiramus]